ncbi:hypothetical protein BpHYR1_039922 [Brachionus plicatilis]|uniref:Uncharacterized protein n=1 Tax=Brachionus plicatilis TaxID=10195 RepID=A0A3M7QCT8_BRAPC|nr:hypothetical protein BpHYR1_039922 [Brachionus plicatilis]
MSSFCYLNLLTLVARDNFSNIDLKSYQSTNVPQNNQNTNHLRVSGNQVTENSMLPKVHSPAGLKNILGHHKRPSQSSLKGNNIIMSSPNILISNSSNSINPNRNKNNDNNSNIHLHDDDIEIMKQRSANNNTFLCIKIPEIQLLVTYKGSCLDKKNIKDLNNVCLLFPLFEVHDQTWTWLDLINALKSHVKKALLSQAIKHKLIKIPIQPVNNLINRNRRSNSQQQLTDSQIEEHEKMKFLKLFGTNTPSNINTKKPENDTKIDSEQTSPVSIKKKSMVSKSKSSIGFGFKKHFSRLNKEKI